MAADINHVVLVGRLTRDAELKYTNSGFPVARLLIAVTVRRKRNEDWVEEGNFFDAVLWGKLGEVLSQYLLKGKQIAIEGQLRQDKWEQDGQPRSKVEIVCSNIELLGGRPSGAPSDSSHAAEAPQDSGATDDFEDDIPF